jgi:dolichyl-diphosphooligosaccharide--protein glycosyltransferase
MNQRPSSPADIQTASVCCSPWFTLLVPCILVYGISLVLRLLELPFWQTEVFEIGGEKLMATHDAYFWMAGAQETSWATDKPLMGLIRFLHQVTSAPMGNIAFYLPVFLAPLAGLPLCYLAWKQDMPEAGIGAGILGTGCLGYLLRTRLGFCDTDPFALLVPALMGTALIIWSSPFVRSSWLPGAGDTKSYATPSKKELLQLAFSAIILGLVGQACFWLYYQSSYIILAFLGVLAGAILILARPGARWFALFGLLCFHGVAFGGWIGLVVALCMTAVFVYLPSRFQSSRNSWSMLALFAVALIVVTGLHNQAWTIISKLIFLTKSSEVESLSNGTSLLLPSVQQSIREAQNVDLANLYSRISGNAILFWSGLMAYLYLIWKKPLFVTFVPILIFSVFSFKLGNRFTMYGGIVWGVGLCFGLSCLLGSLKIASGKRFLAQIILCLVIIWPLWEVGTALRPSPILPKVYAQTFKDLEKVSAKDARLWQWWDYGYAAQYYAQRMSFGDGAKHGGPWLYPLALIHCTDSPAQAAGMIRFTTADQKKTFEESQNLIEHKISAWSLPSYAVYPTTGLERMHPVQAEQFVATMRTNPVATTADIPDQYFVVSWENLRLAYWISYFGNWDLITGTPHPGKIQRMRGQIQLNTQKGLILSGEQTIPIDTLDIINQEGSRRMTWPNGKGLHGIINELSREVYVMDSKIYRSMMVRMLIGQPKDFEDHFKLAVDHFPWARAYKLMRPSRSFRF